MRASVAYGLSVACAAPAMGAERREPTRPCAVAEEADAMAAVAERQEIRLASGRLARIAGLRFATEPSSTSAAAAWLTRHGGRTLAVTVAAPEDRWGRVTSRASTSRMAFSRRA